MLKPTASLCAVHQNGILLASRLALRRADGAKLLGDSVDFGLRRRRGMHGGLTRHSRGEKSRNAGHHGLQRHGPSGQVQGRAGGLRPPRSSDNKSQFLPLRLALVGPISRPKYLSPRSEAKTSVFANASRSGSLFLRFPRFARRPTSCMATRESRRPEFAGRETPFKDVGDEHTCGGLTTQHTSGTRATPMQRAALQG